MENGLLVAKEVTARMSSPGATPIVSGDGTKDAILWVLSTKEWNEAHMDRPAVLHAYDARAFSCTNRCMLETAAIRDHRPSGPVAPHGTARIDVGRLFQLAQFDLPAPDLLVMAQIVLRASSA